MSSSFVTNQRALLALEREAELQEARLAGDGRRDDQQLERGGVLLRKLQVSESRTGLYGKTLITLVSGIHGKELPATSITQGDVVALTKSSLSRDEIGSGIVTQSTSTSIVVSFDADENAEFPDASSDELFRLLKLGNDITHRRLKNALDFLESHSTGSILISCLFGETTLSPALQTLPPKICDPESQSLRFVNHGLDSFQREAVQFSLLQRELAIVHGPPGTGKTTTIVEVITQAVRAGNRVLCCAPSNVAVDNLLERLAQNKVRVVRLGHPARVHEKLQKFSLDALLSYSDQTKLVQDVRCDIDKAVTKLKKARGKGDRLGAQKDLRELRKELRSREKDAMKEVLSHAEVVLSTLTSAAPDGPLKHLPKDHFHMTVIDECSQALEMACWIVLPFAPKTILAGDHLQLPPTIISNEAAGNGLALTLMERVIKAFQAQDVVRMLSRQYRMHEKIMRWSSNALYDGKLIADQSVAAHLLKDLPGVTEDDNTSCPLVLIDTSGCDMYELESEDEISKANESEVGLVCLHVESLIKSGIQAKDIAVITPYNLQVELIRLQLATKYPSLEVRSVDGFQGREKEAVILSLVRANAQGEVGFLAESRRLNVAVTRARRHVAVICCTETVAHDKFLKEFVQYMEEHGDVREESAMQYQYELDGLTLSRPEELKLKLKDDAPKWQSEAKGTKKPVSRKQMTKKSEVAKKPSSAANKKPEPTPEQLEMRTQEKRAEFENLLRNTFFDQHGNELGKEKRHEFPSTLNGHDRLLIHEIAEKWGLIHESVGEGKERRIIVMSSSSHHRRQSEVELNRSSDNLIIKVHEGLKEERASVSAISSSIATRAAARAAAKSAGAAATTSESSALAAEASSSVGVEAAGPSFILLKCSTCQAEVPKVNMTLHKNRCSTPKVSVAVADKKPTEKKKVKKKLKEKISSMNEEEDLDKMLDAFIKLDNVCNFVSCKEKLSVLGTTCTHCRSRFCLSHGMPEVHGCGDAARTAARKQLARDGQLYAGSGRPDHKPDAVRKKNLEKRLEKKKNEFETERSRKPTKKSTKK